MSSSNRSSKEISNDRPSLTADRQSSAAAAAAESSASSPCHSSSYTPFLSVYNVRFPANICEHQSPSFVRRPPPLPGRGGGALVVPKETPSPRQVSPRIKKSAKTKTAESPADLTEVGFSAQEVQTARHLTIMEPIVSRDSKIMSATEVKLIKRETKNRSVNPFAPFKLPHDLLGVGLHTYPLQV